MKMRGQLQFPGMDVPKVTPQPGDMGFDEWAQRNDVIHHGSFSDSWDAGSVTHFGTRKAAIQRLDSAHTMLDSHRMGGYDIELQYGPHTGFGYRELSNHLSPGRVHSRRLDPAGLHHEEIMDDVANMIHSVYDMKMDEIGEGTGVSDDVAGSAADFDADLIHDDEAFNKHLDEQHKGASDALDSLSTNMVVPYENTVEDDGSTSYLVPFARTNSHLSSYAQDVANSNRSRAEKDAFAAHVAKHGEPTIQLSGPNPDTNYLVVFQGNLPFEGRNKSTVAARLPENRSRRSLPLPTDEDY